MKKKYLYPEIEANKLNIYDVMTASGETSSEDPVSSALDEREDTVKDSGFFGM